MGMGLGERVDIRGDHVCCPCGELFPREFDKQGRPTSRRYCPRCRGVSVRERAHTARKRVPEGTPRCARCKCWLGVEWDGAEPAPVGPLCLPCYEWDLRMAEKEARRREVARRGLPLAYYGPFWRAG